MLVRNILMGTGAKIRVGDVTLDLIKAGDRRIRVAVSAPPDVKITMSDGGDNPPVDTHTQHVVGDS
ncbi:hypothetical protein GCM10011345_32780 [Gemmobacter megaterium]|nr:hypothetical protein GCM10011345_32780 [Gemmobacter megaterium]